MPLQHLSWGLLWEASSCLHFLEDFQTNVLLIPALSYLAIGCFHTVLLTRESGSRSGPWRHPVWAPRVFCLNFGPRTQRVELVQSLTSAVDGPLSVLTLGP